MFSRFYAKRCFLSLIENLAKHMIVARDSVFQECIQFLEHCEGMHYILLSDSGCSLKHRGQSCLLIHFAVSGLMCHSTNWLYYCSVWERCEDCYWTAAGRVTSPSGQEYSHIWSQTSQGIAVTLADVLMVILALLGSLHT